MCLHHLKRIYVIQQLNESGECEDLYYCKKRKTRDLVYESLLMLDFGEHFKEWARLHNYDNSQETWDYYLDNVQPTDRYYFADGKIDKDNFIYKNYMMEDLIKQEEEKKAKEEKK